MAYYPGTLELTQKKIKKGEDDSQRVKVVVMPLILHAVSLLCKHTPSVSELLGRLFP